MVILTSLTKDPLCHSTNPDFKRKDGFLYCNEMHFRTRESLRENGICQIHRKALDSACPIAACRHRPEWVDGLNRSRGRGSFDPGVCGRLISEVLFRMLRSEAIRLVSQPEQSHERFIRKDFTAASSHDRRHADAQDV